MTDDDEFDPEEFFAAEDEESDGGEPESVELPRPRRLVVAFGLALAAAVFIGIAGVALLAVLIFRVRDHTDPNHSIRHKYEARYSSCVQRGGDKYGCGITVLNACESDHYWTNPDRVGQRETVCEATVPGVSD